MNLLTKSIFKRQFLTTHSVYTNLFLRFETFASNGRKQTAELKFSNLYKNDTAQK